MENFYIKEHSVQNIGGFRGKHAVKLDSLTCNVIMGTNGTGKTTILNSIYLNVLSAFASITGLSHTYVDISTSSITNGEIESICNSIICSNFEGDSGEMEIGFRFLQNGQIQVIGSDLTKLRNIIKRRFQESNLTLPILRYFKSNRSINKGQSIVSSQNFNKIDNRNIGYNNHYIPTFLIQEITSFIIDQLNIENQEKVRLKNFDYQTRFAQFIRKTFIEFTKALYEQEMPIAVGKSKFSNGQSLLIQKNDEVLEFSQLSSGEEYLIALILEIIYRICQTNPYSTDLKNTPGIIVIDEIESHLHPKWQLNIIKALTSAFPNIQFIISTHSPLVASSVKADQIILISNFEFLPKESIPSIYSGSANQILKEIMNTDEKIDEFEEENILINKLILEKNYLDAKIRLDALKNKIESNPDWIVQLEKRLNFISQER